MMSKPESKTTRMDWMLAGIAFLLMLVAVPLVISQLAPNAPEPAAPRLTLSEGLQDALLFLGLCVVAVGALLTYMGRVARHRGRTEDTPREDSRLMVERDEWKKLATDAQDQNASLQALNVVLIDERNEWMGKALNKDRRIKELEQAAAMHHQAMLNQRAELEQARTQIPLGIQQAAALIDMIATERTPAVRRVIPFLRELGIPVTKAGYETLSAAVHRLRAPSPTEQAQPVRDAATEKKPANARRERANGRTRTHPRTRKA